VKIDSHKLWSDSEYNYPRAYGFVPNLMSFTRKNVGTGRPCMIVVPGGGYRSVSPTEGELVAKKFFNKGYNTFILTYTTNLLADAPLKLQPLNDISRAVRYVRLHAADLGIDPGKIVLCGFSAGAHLCASACVHYADISDTGDYAAVSNRPDAAVLSYPVISAGEKGHGNSFLALFGNEACAEELEYMSLEKHVKRDTPPCFIWHTAADELVPVDNSLLFADSCRKAGVIFSLHIFSEGPHGLSLADDDWAAGRWGSEHTNEQMRLVMEKVSKGEIELTPEGKEAAAWFSNPDKKTFPERKVNSEAAQWPEMAEIWLSRVLRI